MGTVANRQTPADYDADMKLAKSSGIDAFALNIGNDPHKHKQLDLAYQSAETNGMKVFISFDFASFALDCATVGGLISDYGNKAAQLKVDNKVFVSSFLGDGLNVADLRAKSSVEIYFAPNFYPEKTASSNGIDAALNWVVRSFPCISLYDNWFNPHNRHGIPTVITKLPLQVRIGQFHKETRSTKAGSETSPTLLVSTFTASAFLFNILMFH